MDDVLVGGVVADAPLSAAPVPDGPLAGAVVVEAEIDVELGAGQGIAGAPGKDGTAVHSYPVAIAAAGDTAIPLPVPPRSPTDVALFVNGVAYRAPAITLSAVLLTWAGPFALSPDDAVFAVYA